MWVTVPSGATFPGTTAMNGSGPPGPDQFSSDSSWKFAWLLQDQSAYDTTSQFDLVNFTYGGYGQFIPAESNANYYMYIEPGRTYYENANNIGTSWWSWNGWNRVTTWLRGNSTVPTGAPGGMVQTLNAQHGMSTWEIGNPATYPTSAMFQNGVGQYFTQINVPGWIREISGPNARSDLPDDIYIAVGPRLGGAGGGDGFAGLYSIPSRHDPSRRELVGRQDHRDGAERRARFQRTSVCVRDRYERKHECSRFGD